MGVPEVSIQPRSKPGRRRLVPTPRCIPANDTPLNTTVPSLALMTKGALNVLDNDPDGFFVMIEGGAVDWANHANQLGRLIQEQNDFNDAVDVAIDWIKANGGFEKNLLIVTGDHETGYLDGSQPGVFQRQ